MKKKEKFTAEMLAAHFGFVLGRMKAEIPAEEQGDMWRGLYIAMMNELVAYANLGHSVSDFLEDIFKDSDIYGQQA